MFGRKNKEEHNDLDTAKSNGSSNGAPTGSTCVIAAGTKIEGKITCTEDVRLDGTVVGEMTCDKKLVMGNTGTVDGQIKSVDSAIHGKVKGEIKSSGTLHLHESANIDGVIVARKMQVDSGASYSGECKVGDQHFK